MPRVSRAPAAAAVSTRSNLCKGGIGLASNRVMPRADGQIARRCQILTTLVCGFGALLAAGCDECELGQWQCQDGVYSQCIDDGDGPFATNHWSGNICKGMCLVVGDRKSVV